MTAVDGPGCRALNLTGAENVSHRTARHMIDRSHEADAADAADGTDAADVGRPRLLPWSNLDGKPCYLITDDTGAGRLARVADRVEAIQLGMAGDLLDHATDLLGDDDNEATRPQLRFLAARLVESLHDVHRIARSRGARLPAPHDEGGGRP